MIASVAVAAGYAAVLLGGAGVAGGMFWLNASVPNLDGTFPLPGLAAPAEVVRDANGIPLIIAQSDTDAYAALGFIHAQDRLWQMDLQRRAAKGQLAAIAGEDAFRSDRLMRTLDVAGRAERQFARLAPDVQAAFQAYANGVNAWLGVPGQRLPPEFALAGFEPEPWVASDGLLWGGLMAVRLSGSWRAQYLRMRLAKRLAPERIDQLLDEPGQGGGQLAAVPAANAPPSTLARLADNALPPPPASSESGSNAWVLDGSLTRSGKPLLANDPHLALTFPGIWYLARLVGPGFDIRGASSPGSPAIVLGHNGTIGWGFTTTNLDSQDLFVERVDPTDPSRYITPDGARPFTVRDETINVLWGDPVSLRVRQTRHGVVIDDFLARRDDPVNLTPAGHVLALQATALDGADTSGEGFSRLGQAQNWEEFQTAARKIVSPMQNMVYADTAGNTGLLSPARVPIRRKGDGSMPVPGWTGEYDWAGFVPFDALPRAYNPANGILVNANARVVPDNYRYFISRDWAEPYRQRRANQMLHEVERHPVYGMIVIQADNLSLDAVEMVPLLLKSAPRNPRAAKAHAALASWNHFMLASRPEPLIYTAWLTELQRGLLADELGEALYESLTTPNVALLTRILREKPGWCDDGGTRATETCDDAIAQALERALDRIAKQQGADLDKWQWGVAHLAVHRHPLFDGVPLLRDIASVRFPSDGGAQTLNRAQPSYRGPRPFDATHGAGYRAVYDFADLDNSRFAIPLGQSGNMLSPWARNFVDRWQALRYIEIAGTRAENARTAVGTITLAPPVR